MNEPNKEQMMHLLQQTLIERFKHSGQKATHIYFGRKAHQIFMSNFDFELKGIKPPYTYDNAVCILAEDLPEMDLVIK